MLANRCLASGTNAWTGKDNIQKKKIVSELSFTRFYRPDTDHTCYTMTTAGKDGFLELLPIYLDHILYPTLTVSQLHCGVNSMSTNRLTS